MKVIEIKNLKKHFGKTKAVDGISFDIKKGEIFGFLGPNGAGKTTTIRCIMDFIRPSAGKIKVLGMDSKEDTVAIKEKVGYLPGNVRLNNNWTGWDHIRFVESIRGKSENVYDLIERFDFNPKTKFKNLSSGNKQKLGLILSLMSDPEIIIMDEPTLGLDPLLQNSIYEVLLEFKKKGRTIFISSHNLPEVERLCDRVGIIKAGKMVEVDSIKQLKKKKMHQVEVHFTGKYSKTDFEGDGVESVQEIPGGLLIMVKGGLNQIVKRLAKYDISDLEITHASLEEIFLKFYERK